MIISNLIGSASRWQYDVAFEGDYLGKQGILKSNFGVKIRTQKDRFYQLKFQILSKYHRCCNLR